MKPVPPVTAENSLANFPLLAAEFNIERNNINSDQINANSKGTQKYWWKCIKEHEWQSTLRNRVEQNGKCPYCAGRLATPENNLLTLHPTIASMFDEEKNGKSAADVTPTYDGKMHWTCSNGHDFLKSPRETVKTKGMCRGCNSLAYKFPDLREFYHEDNAIPFESLSYGSNKKVKWSCENKHEYDQTVSHKTTRGLGCPYCSGRYATPESNLLLAYPEIAKEFDPAKSGTTADRVTPKSNRNMWWNCDKGHSYKTTPAKKTREDLPYGCPFCSGYQINETNSFGALFPELAKEFLTGVNNVSAYEVPCGRTRIIYSWQCKKAGHIYEMSIAARTKKGYSCPYCSGRYPTPQNNLAVIKPEDAKHFHPTKNGNLTPFDFTPSSNKKVHWICEKGHEWSATPNAKKGCARCVRSATSKVEALLRESILNSGIMDWVKDEGAKLRIQWRNNSSLNVDILATFGNKKFAIEYDGYYFHSGIHSGDKTAAYLKDTQKTQALLDAGYCVIRVREINFNGTLSFLEIDDTRLLQLHHRYSNRLPVGTFDRAIHSISEWIATL